MRLCALLTLILLTAISSTQAGWKAGVGRVVITPDQPLWMSGYASRDHAATGKNTDLWAKALVLEDEQGRRGVIISLDLVGIDRQTSLQIRNRLIENHDLSMADIAICTSHTHSGPVFGSTLKAMYDLEPAEWDKLQAYTRRTSDQIVRIVGEAFSELREAELSFGVGHCDVAVNRRENREPDVPALREQGELKGPVDHEVPVLRVSSGGDPIAVMFGYACHATTLSGYEWDGDWPGYAQIAIEQTRPGVTALFFAGCGADQNPLPRRSVELAQKYGKQIARSIDEALEADMKPLAATLKTTYREIDLPFAHVPDQDELQQALSSDNIYDVRRARHQMELYGDASSIPSSYPYPVQTWALDDVTGVFLGGEVVVDYSLAIKGLDRHVDFVAGYANDVMAYIPSERVLTEGGYEGARSMVYYGQPSAWQSGLEAALLETVRQQLQAVAP
jgi:neutral ceramidase